MPTYEYAPVEEESTNECCRFEVFQKMSESPLANCPTCGAPIRRVFSAPAVHGASSVNSKMSNKNLAELGFTKYVKAGDGHYEKAAGKGPNVIRK